MIDLAQLAELAYAGSGSQTVEAAEAELETEAAEAELETEAAEADLEPIAAETEGVEAAESTAATDAVAVSVAVDTMCEVASFAAFDSDQRGTVAVVVAVSVACQAYLASSQGTLPHDCLRYLSSLS